MPFELSEGYGKDFSTLRNVFSKVEKLFFLTKPQNLFITYKRKIKNPSEISNCIYPSFKMIYYIIKI